MWRGLWFLRKKISPRAAPKASFFDTPLPCHFSAGIWKLKILDFVRQTCNYLALSELRDNLRSCIGMIWTGKNCTENKRSTSGYLTAYTYILTRKRNLTALRLKYALYTILCALYAVVNVQFCFCHSRRGVQSVYSWRCTSSSACRNCDDLRSCRRS